MKKLTKKDFYAPEKVHICKIDYSIRILEKFGKFYPQHHEFNKWKPIIVGGIRNIYHSLQEAIDIINEYLNQ